MVETGTDQAAGGDDGSWPQHLPSSLMSSQQGAHSLQLLPPGQQGGKGALGNRSVTRPSKGFYRHVLTGFLFLLHLLLLPLLLPPFPSPSPAAPPVIIPPSLCLLSLLQQGAKQRHHGILKNMTDVAFHKPHLDPALVSMVAAGGLPAGPAAVASQDTLTAGHLAKQTRGVACSWNIVKRLM